MCIGERVKQLRKKKGLTQSELASLLGYKSKSSVAHIENGRDIPRPMVATLANILDTTPAYLMGWTDIQENAKAKQSPAPSDDELKFALFDGSEGVTDEMFEEVKQFAAMVKMREDAKKEKK